MQATPRPLVRSPFVTARLAVLLLIAGPFLLLGEACSQDVKKPGDKKHDAKKLGLEVKQKVYDFGKMIVDAKGSKDAEAIAIIEDLLPKYEIMSKSDRSKFAKAVGQSLTSRRVKRDPVNDGLYRSVVRALGSLEQAGSGYLDKAYDHNKFKDKDWLSLRGEMLEQLGRTKDEKHIKALTDVARRADEDILRTKAGAALGYFVDAPLKARKEIAKQLIREFINIDSNANLHVITSTEPGVREQQIRSKQRLAAVRSTWNATLQKLTKQQITAPAKWQDFYNSPDWKRDWDKLAAQSAGKGTGK